jgi:hypothetical protein
VTLAAIEELLFGLITAPEGVADGLARARLSARDLEAVVDGDARRSAVGRLDIYANMYFFRILDVLRADYPKLLQALGDDGFHNLATDYLLACPSRHPSIRNVGARLPQFLDGRGTLTAPPAPPSFGGAPSWHADLARLEWARQDVFDAADAAPLTVEALREIAADDFARLAIALVPAHRRLELGHTVDDYWSDGEAPRAEARTLIVWREGTDVYHRPVDAREAEALALVADGALFGHVCELVCGRVSDGEDPALVAAGLLGRWASDGLIARSERS